MFKDQIEYSAWHDMVRRCSDPKAENFKWYGGRGITVCERWLGVKGFKNFLKDLGKRPKGLTLDRLDNNKGYSPDNCQWRSWEDQSLNKRPKISPDTKEKFVSIKRRKWKGVPKPPYYRVLNEKKGINRTFKTIEEAVKFRDKLIKEGVL